MTLPVKALLSQCVHGKTSDDYVFTREDGKPVRNFRGALEAACEAARCQACSSTISGEQQHATCEGLESQRA